MDEIEMLWQALVERTNFLLDRIEKLERKYKKLLFRVQRLEGIK